MSSTGTASRARNPAECPWSADVIRSWQTVFASYKQKLQTCCVERVCSCCVTLREASGVTCKLWQST
ncbi:hypothetical protein CIB84_006413 [Bambusicola thoracicus]|uniref:Uncharacterized protein n=1 Tax=Bambusicola thoracicus TaxID=9083 RepID=A0A2P4T0F1_BAMTH|nr:hypothetical protein CIB84_006413 [Bambusicola thoracicus]